MFLLAEKYCWKLDCKQQFYRLKQQTFRIKHIGAYHHTMHTVLGILIRSLLEFASLHFISQFQMRC